MRSNSASAKVSAKVGVETVGQGPVGRGLVLAGAMRDGPGMGVLAKDDRAKGGLTVVDFETTHLGDPAFDLGSFASHLLLKALREAPAHEPISRMRIASPGPR